MDIDLKIRKILQDYQVNGDVPKAKHRLSGLKGFVVVQSKIRKINSAEINKIEDAYKNFSQHRRTSWKTRMIFR